MPPSSDDPRKKFILATTGNFYGVRPGSSLSDSPELNNFLDNGNEFLLSANRNDNDLHFSNKVMRMLKCYEKICFAGPIHKHIWYYLF